MSDSAGRLFLIESGKSSSPSLETGKGRPDKLLLVISALDAPGGAERILTGMANFWARQGREVVMLTFDPPGVEPFFPLEPSVRVVPLDLLSDSRSLLEGVRSNARRIRRLRRALRDQAPALVIAFGDVMNILVLLASAGLGIPVIVSERAMPGTFPLRPQWRLLRTTLYRLADAIVVQGNNARDRLARFGGRIHVIPNPVARPEMTREGPSRLVGTIVGAGRFTVEKGFVHLIDAFAASEARTAGWSLVIYGDGPLRPNLEKRIAFHRLEDQVSLPGRAKDLSAELARADLFVLSSLHEGFPNVLCEAMAAGLPVVATDCPSAVRDIVRVEMDGILVPPSDPVALARAIDRLASDPEERSRRGSACRDVTERFAPEVVMGEWERLLRKLMRRS
jgi:GalNAc-alpha-(1->4)-GalNAc-alpha-(1->3)-diNAcBac-PP-undecaprenol alpha-1,4-N-acetyl-D-galactosaminyltransferase